MSQHPHQPINLEFKVGGHDQAIKMILESQARMETSIAEIRDAISEQKGERRVAVWVAGAAGSAFMVLLGAIGRKLGITS